MYNLAADEAGGGWDVSHLFQTLAFSPLKIAEGSIIPAEDAPLFSVSKKRRSLSDCLLVFKSCFFSADISDLDLASTLVF